MPGRPPDRQHAGHDRHVRRAGFGEEEMAALREARSRLLANVEG